MKSSSNADGWRQVRPDIPFHPDEVQHQLWGTDLQATGPENGLFNDAPAVIGNPLTPN